MRPISNNQKATSRMTDSQRFRRNLIFLLFAISGFSGLIYEAIWSHYLKLFLGHAAYAQTLVLAIFMGGMAIGAAMAGRYSATWKNLLLVYALVEVIVGICAVIFHGVFVVATDLSYDVVIPALGSPLAVNLFKWGLAALLILPQSILLGATFPLVSAAVIRRFPGGAGSNLAMLYFTNSFGAAIGVLVSGFVLIDLVGLPGTILTAGLINIALAMMVMVLAKESAERPIPAARPRASVFSHHTLQLLLGLSLLTGAASFMYEIGWIRMLSLVLGSSTHAFELMLSAFIFGLAFGGLWIRRRIDQLRNPIRFLALVQVIMGLLALSTLVVYNASFDVMQAIMQTLTPTPSGYTLFNVASHGIALGIMIPTTFCAGMTLPLITHLLLRQGQGEKSIGAVYAANTVGAIIGVFVSVHVGLPLVGVKGVIVLGAALDIALGIALIYHSLSYQNRWALPAMMGAAALVIGGVLLGVELDKYKMTSGVYRHGTLLDQSEAQLLYHKDGKTATVDLLQHRNGIFSIRTNGKPDAALNLSSEGAASRDESTMVLVAAIPLAMLPQARSAANIGLGSALTAHVLLGNPSLERVDTIEIEPAIVEAARGFGKRVETAYSDPRSKIHIDDAKTFFASHHGKYDIIISEPSNPWVSGVAGLYTEEFYHRVRRHMNPNGVFVQWIPIYETDMLLVTSIMKALGNSFRDYVVYAANDADIIIAASNDRKLPPPNLQPLKQSRLAIELERVEIITTQDLSVRRIGDRAILEPLFVSLPVTANSDYFPLLDLNAVRVRFMRSDAFDIIRLGKSPLPVLEMLSDENANPQSPVTWSKHFNLTQSVYMARRLGRFHLPDIKNHELTEVNPDLARRAVMVLKLGQDCDDRYASSLWFDEVYQLAKVTLPFISAPEARALTNRWRASDCIVHLSQSQIDWLDLFNAVGQRNPERMAVLAEKLLSSTVADIDKQAYLLGAGMLGYVRQQRLSDARQLWVSHSPKILQANPPGLMLPLLWAHSFLPNRPAATLVRN